MIVAYMWEKLKNTQKKVMVLLLIEAFKGKTSAEALAIRAGAAEACSVIFHVRA